MKKIILLAAILFAFTTILSSCNNATSQTRDANTELELAEGKAVHEISATDNKATTKIQVAILLDTSSSMDGLIEQAKSRLWNIVNTLTTLKYQGKTPTIEIAVYEYGNDGIRTDDYIRQVTPLTTDLDLISEKLFALSTNGGYEYCGAVIDKATRALNWGSNDADMKLVYIAGNEPFDQGSIPYRKAIDRALAKGIYVNTIHCGYSENGVKGYWQDAAVRGKGKYFNIDSNAKVRYVVTPYDDRISACNQQLNNTYMGYGRTGREKKANQAMQDKNAGSISSSNSAERTVSKTKSVYDNKSWDLVDMAKDDKSALGALTQEELPSELQGKTKVELEKIVSEKQKERDVIQKEIGALAQKRQAYIDEELKNDTPSGDDLGYAIAESVLSVAKAKGYVVEK